MTYRIAVCDDDSAILSDMEAGVRRWAADAGHVVLIEAFPSAEAFLFRYAEEKSFDILLLDIEMGRMNGVELAKKIRTDNREVQIIFVTGYSDYIADGYDVEALHYLMKPIDGQKLRAVLSRAVEKLRRNERALVLNCPDAVVRIPLYQIAYIEAQKNYIHVHAREAYAAKRTLSDVEKELDERFFRMGRSFIINLNDVRKISRTAVYLKSGDVLPLPRGAYDSLNQALIRCL